MPTQPPSKRKWQEGDVSQKRPQPPPVPEQPERNKSDFAQTKDSDKSNDNLKPQDEGEQQPRKPEDAAQDKSRSKQKFPPDNGKAMKQDQPPSAGTVSIATGASPYSSPIAAPPVVAKEDSIVTPERVLIYKRTRFNPIRGLTPDLLSRQIESFKAGTLREYARTMEDIASRDTKIMTVMPKRIGALKRRNWEIVVNPHVPEASDDAVESHKKVLQYFYESLTVTDAVDLNKTGSVTLLIEQMLTGALAYKYSVHEVLWKPSPAGLTARMNWVPLWFFENHMGRLRFLLQDFAWDGIDLDAGGWVITVGPHLMLPCSVCWMFKRLAVQDWVNYSERHGLPGLIGKTTAPSNSERWTQLHDLIENFGNDFGGVINTEDMIDSISFAAEGEIPMPKLVDYMDRELTSIWRGGDLSTMSSQANSQGFGASLQGDEGYVLEASDMALINDTLNASIDRQVIEWAFGEGTFPLCNFKVVVPPVRNIDLELKTDDFLLKNKVPLGMDDMMERYGRAKPSEGEELVEAPEPVSPFGVGGMFGGIGGQGEEMEEGEEGFGGNGRGKIPPQFAKKQPQEMFGKKVPPEQQQSPTKEGEKEAEEEPQPKKRFGFNVAKAKARL